MKVNEHDQLEQEGHTGDLSITLNTISPFTSYCIFFGMGGGGGCIRTVWLQASKQAS